MMLLSVFRNIAQHNNFHFAQLQIQFYLNHFFFFGKFKPSETETILAFNYD